MTSAVAVLLAVAKELAETAKSSMPEMRDGEKVIHEWFEEGIYYRETELAGEIFVGQYDFRQKKSRLKNF